MFAPDNDAIRLVVRERHEQLAQDARRIASRSTRSARKRRVLVVSLTNLLELRHRRAQTRPGF